MWLVLFKSSSNIQRALIANSGEGVTRGTPKSPNNVTSTFFNTVHLRPKDVGWNTGVQNLFLGPGAIWPWYAPEFKCSEFALLPDESYSIPWLPVFFSTPFKKTHFIRRYLVRFNTVFRHLEVAFDAAGRRFGTTGPFIRRSERSAGFEFQANDYENGECALKRRSKDFWKDL